jgi:hypothetical protein
VHFIALLPTLQWPAFNLNLSRTGIPDSSGGTVTRLRTVNTKNRGFIPPAAQIIDVCFIASKPDLEPTQAPVQWVLCNLIPEIKQSECKAGHSLRLGPTLTPELNTSAQRCLTRFLLGILLLEPCILLIYAWKTNKYTNYSFSLLTLWRLSFFLNFCTPCI